jgi:AraC family transcriptional regulator
VPLVAPPPDAPGDGIEVLTIPAGPAAVTVHRGPYDTLPQTYRLLETWLDREGHTGNGPPREVYLTDVPSAPTGHTGGPRG